MHSWQNAVNEFPRDTILSSLFQEKRYSGFHEEPTELSEERPNAEEQKDENVIQGMFSDNEEILKFFQDGVSDDTETEIN